MSTVEKLSILIAQSQMREIESPIREYLNYCNSLKQVGLLKEKEVSFPMIDTLGNDLFSSEVKKSFANSIE